MPDKWVSTYTGHLVVLDLVPFLPPAARNWWWVASWVRTEPGPVNPGQPADRCCTRESWPSMTRTLHPNYGEHGGPGTLQLTSYRSGKQPLSRNLTLAAPSARGSHGPSKVEARRAAVAPGRQRAQRPFDLLGESQLPAARCGVARASGRSTHTGGMTSTRMWVHVPIALPGTHGVILQAHPWVLAHRITDPGRVDDVVTCDDGVRRPMAGWRAYVYHFSPRVDTRVRWAAHRAELWLDDEGCVQLVDAEETPLLPPGTGMCSSAWSAWERMELAYCRHLGIPGERLEHVLPAMNVAGELYDAMVRGLSDD